MKVELNSVSVCLGERMVLRDVTLDLPASSSTAIIGVSGAGKTTLLRTLAGLIAPSTGSVRLGGRAPHHVYGKGALAFLFQEACLWRHLTATETIQLAFKLNGKKPAATQIDLALDRVGLADFRNEYPHRMSVGMKARLTLARSFCTEPELLLMDEPFAALDPMRRLDLNRQVDIMRRDTNCGVVWVTHDIIEAIQFASHIVALAPSSPGGVQVFSLTSLPPIDDGASLPIEALALRTELMAAIMQTNSFPLPCTPEFS